MHDVNSLSLSDICFLITVSCSLEIKHKSRQAGKVHGFQSDRGLRLLSPSISRLRKELNQQALLQAGSQHNAETTRDQRFTSVSINSELGERCLHHLRQMPHGINTGTLADRQMSQSHNLR